MCVSSLLVGCTKYGHLPNEEMPYIAVDMRMDQTKALISQDNLNTDGSRFLVYDMHTSASKPAQYLDNQNLELRNGTWSFTKTAGGDIIQIPWTKTGTHDFLAYNTYDAAAGKSLPVSVLYSPSNTSAKQQSLRVPSQDTWTLNLDLENQFDFIYGSATRNVETDGYTALPISFKHLFAAIAVEVRNAATQNLTITSLSFSNIKDRGYAQINYNGNVSYSLSASQASSLFQQTYGPVSAGGLAVLYSSLGAGQAFLIWPHSAADLANASIYIKYKLGNTTTEKTIKLTENFTVKTWNAGNKYKYQIGITDNNISFDVIRVVDWINDDVILEE